MPRPTNTYIKTIPHLVRSQPSVSVPATTPGYTLNTQGYLSPLSNQFAAWNGQSQSTESGLLGLPAAWRGINLIANAVALMMTSADVYQRVAPHFEVDHALPMHNLILNPNRLYSPHEFWAELTSTVIMHGNYIAVKADFDENGFPQQVIPVHPNSVECRLTEQGYPLYRIGEKIYTYDEVIHIRGFTRPGVWWGMGIIEVMRKQISADLNMQAFSNNTYSNASVPSVVINLDVKPGTMSQTDIATIKADWIRSFGSGQREPVITTAGMSVDTLSWTPEDMQFISAQSFQVAQMAFILGLDPSDLGASISQGTALTYANISERETHRLKYTYAPWLNRIEQRFSDCLEEGYVRGNPAAILRADTKSRYDAYAIALTNGFMTVNEIRSLERLEPLPEVLPQRDDDDDVAA